nr:hypothetical protein [Tanacetum cinerariifolium]
MHTKSSSKLSRDQTSNPTSSTNPTPKGRIRQSSKQKVENSNFEENPLPLVPMAENLTMAQLLQAPTGGYEDAIVIPEIAATNFELKHEPCYIQNFSDNNSSRDLPSLHPLIDHHCCYECGNSLNDFFCYQCTCKFCGNGAHVGYNFPAQVPSVQTLPSFPQQYPCCEDSENIEEKQLEEERAAKAQNWKLPVCYDDDDDEERSDSLDDNIISGLPSSSAITPDEPVLSTEEPDNSLSMGEKIIDTIPATESDEFIKSGVEDLIPILSKSEGTPEHVCDVPSHDNSPPLDVSKDQIEDFFESNEEFSSTDDDSFSFDKIDYVEASPPDSELVSSEVMEIVTQEVGGIKASNDNLILFYDPIISGTPPRFQDQVFLHFSQLSLGGD